MLYRTEHVELKSSAKSVAADQIKCACQDYWGGPAGPPHATALIWVLESGVELGWERESAGKSILHTYDSRCILVAPEKDFFRIK